MWGATSQRTVSHSQHQPAGECECLLPQVWGAKFPLFFAGYGFASPDGVIHLAWCRRGKGLKLKASSLLDFAYLQAAYRLPLLAFFL